jgi:hypothetical protein
MRYSVLEALRGIGMATALVLIVVGTYTISHSSADDSSSKSISTKACITSKPILNGIDPASRASSIAKNYGNLPLSFEVNNGQVDETVRFLSRGSGYTLFLTSTEAVLSLRRAASKGKEAILAHSPEAVESKPIAGDIVRLKLVGANPSPKIAGLEELPGKSNYFIGKEPAKWRTGVSNYAKVKIQDVYPGIDLVYYGNQRQLEYDWIVNPGADAKTITFAVEGQTDPRVDAQSNLILDVKGELRLNQPFIYQQGTGSRMEISGRYALLGKGKVGFQVDKYDVSLPLVIDPVLSFSTYLGGRSYDEGNGIAVDSSGNAYVTGYTYSTNFPTASAFQASKGAGSDVFVTKLNATGSALLYSTFLGGSGEEIGRGIAVDSSGNAYVTGTTLSINFPTSNAFQTNNAIGFTQAGEDAFIARIGFPLYSGITVGDGDSDGKADFSIWRPVNGVWYLLHSSSPGTYTSTQWGLSTDVPVAGDYDGDGKMDIAVWRPGTGVWYILPSNSPGAYTATQWGLSADIPLPLDYDGDGRMDVAVWRPGSGVFYVLPSNSPGAYTATQWGLAGDIPIFGRKR